MIVQSKKAWMLALISAIIVLGFAGTKAGATAQSLSLQNDNFEDNLSGWQLQANGGSASVTSTDSYYGTGSLKFQVSTTSGSSVTLSQQLNGLLPGQKAEAGFWVKKTSSQTSVQILVQAKNSAGTTTVLAQSTAGLTLPLNKWTYVLSQPVNNRTYSSGTTVSVVLKATGAGGALVDFVQAGPQNSITGNPVRYAILAYQPWYGTAANWHNWEWTGGGGPDHNPSVILPNGKRDTASYDYPMIGAYDSKDPNVLRYHVNLAKAMGFNCIQVNWYATLEPDFVQTFNTLLSIAEESDMKVSVLYEPKIHLSTGWIPHNTRQEQLNAIVNDIVSIEQTYGQRKGMLKVRGRTVVGIFDTDDLTGSEWNSIVQSVHGNGYNPYMMGNLGAPVTSSFDSMFNWWLYTDQMAANPSSTAVRQFSAMINGDVQNWVAGDQANRLGVGIVWPGFNDSGVYGWGSGTSHVIPETASFYQDTWDGLWQTWDSTVNPGLDWLIVTTFNDWNEGTEIEPSKRFGYSRAIQTQNNIVNFRGIDPLDNNLMQQITEAYLNNKNVIHYK